MPKHAQRLYESSRHTFRAALLLLAGGAGTAHGAHWAVDVAAPGIADAAIVGDSLRRNGQGVDMLVAAFDQFPADQRLVSISDATAEVQWRAANAPIRAIGNRRSSAAGWVELGLGAPCDVALRNPAGQLQAQAKKLGAGNCTHALFDEAGAVVVVDGTAVALDAQARERWRQQPENLGVSAVHPVRGLGESVWVAASQSVPAGPALVRLDGADGTELARSTLEIGTTVRELRGRSDGGVHAMVSQQEQGIRVHAFDANGQFQASADLVPAQAVPASIQVVTSDTGIAACWLENDGRVHVRVLDAQLQARWPQTLLPYDQSGAAASRCQLALSSAGRLGVVLTLPSVVALVRLDPHGNLVDSNTVPNNGFSTAGLIFAADESLWTARVKELRRYDGDQPGVARLLDLQPQGALPQLFGVSTRADGGAAAVLAEIDRGPIHLLKIDAQGRATRSPDLSIADPSRVVALADGWLIAAIDQLVRLRDDGTIRWQRTQSAYLLKCTSTGMCAAGNPSFPARVSLFDNDGQRLWSQELSFETMVYALAHDQRTDRLYAQTSDGAFERLLEITSSGLVEKVRVARNGGPSQFGPLARLVRTQSNLVEAIGELGLAWSFTSRAGYHLGQGVSGEFYEVPNQNQLHQQTNVVALDPDGKARQPWDQSTHQFTFLRNRTEITELARLGIAGLPERTAWLGEVTAAGSDAYSVRIIDGPSNVEHRFELPEAAARLMALKTTEDDQAAVVVYPVRAGDQPRLRFERIEQWLFRDGLE